MARTFLLFFAFFLSGFGSLIHEVVWQRMLVTLFGSTVYATSTILFIYMAGLGIGAYVAPRLIKKEYIPARTYFLCELGIAVYAVSFPAVFALVSFMDSLMPYSNLYLHFLYRFVLSIVFLLPPVFLMGASFPFFCALFKQEDSPSSWAAYAYAVNTFGGAAGTLASGFFLIKHFGLTQTQLIAAFSNACAGMLVLVLAKNILSQPEKTSLSSYRTSSAAAFISGCIALFCEVIFTRVLITIFGSTVYVFALLLFSFLTGIALGAFLIENGLSLIARMPKLSLLFLCTAFSLIVSKYILGLSPYIYLTLLAHHEVTLFRYHTAQLVTAYLILIFPALMFGAIFSACLHRVKSAPSPPDAAAGTYAANTAGASLGALLAIPGFLIFGFEGSLVFAAVVCIVASFAFAAGEKGTSILTSVVCGAGMGIALLALPSWNMQVLSRGVFDTGIRLLAQRETIRSNPELIKQMLMPGGTHLFHHEGLHSTVDVFQIPNTTFLKINGKTNASTSRDMLTQLLLGYIPMVLHPQPHDVLVIGLGSGVTLKAVLDFDVSRVELVELERGVLTAASYFKAFNNASYSDNRVRIIFDDGRHFLQKTTSSYHVIISEPSHPWFGTNSLYTKEFYRLAYEKLQDDGIFAQWIGIYALDVEATKTALRTFQSVFEDASVYETLLGDIVLVGRKNAQPFSLSRIARQIKSPRLASVLKPYNFHNPVVFMLATFMLDRSDLRKFTGGGPLNADNFPYLEFAGADAFLSPLLGQRNHSALAISKTTFYPDYIIEKNKIITDQQLYNVALAKLHQLDPEDMLGIVKRLLKTHPEDAPLYHLLGQAYVLVPDIQSAANAFEKELRLNPDSAYGWYDLSLCYRIFGQEQKALDALRRARKLKPDISGPDVPFN